MSLYLITGEMITLLNAFYDYGKDSPEAEAAIREHAAAIAEAFDAKADSYAALIRSCELRADSRHTEARRMTALAEADEALADRLRDALKNAMEITGRTKVDTERFRLSVKKNGGAIPVVISDQSLIPHNLMIPKMTMSVDRDAVRKVFESGGTVEGASLGVRGSRLDIK